MIQNDDGSNSIDIKSLIKIQKVINNKKKNKISKLKMSDTKKYIFAVKNQKNQTKNLILNELSINLKNAKCNDFLSILLFLICGKDSSVKRDALYTETRLKLIQQLNMKHENLTVVKFIDYLYTTAIETESTDNYDPLRLLKQFVNTYKNREAIIDKNLCFGVNCVNGRDFDFNFREKRQSE